MSYKTDKRKIKADKEGDEKIRYHNSKKKKCKSEKGKSVPGKVLWTGKNYVNCIKSFKPSLQLPGIYMS